MKKILLFLSAFILSALMIACTDTKDCVCEATDGTQFNVADWDSSCSDISVNDVPNLGTNPCSEVEL